MVIVALSKRYFILSVLFFIPVLLHIIIDTMSKEIVVRRKSAKILFSSSTFTGAVISYFLNISEHIEFVLLGIMGGTLLYFAVRESIPADRKGNVFYFILGVICSGVLILYMRGL